jgi:type I restriction enzyme S subunit
MSLPSYTDLKESGVEWLGQVPRNWGISRLGFESWVRARLGWKGLKAEEYVDDGFVFLSTPNIKGMTIDFENVNYIDEYRYKESPEIKLQIGDVLLAKDGSTLGTVNLVRCLPRPATVNSSIAVITPRRTLAGSFLHYLFQSSYIEHTIQRIKGGMGVPHLFQEDLNKFYIPLPDVREQECIATFLDRETAKIDALVAEQQRLIALLKEKRQAVISHAVTKGVNPAVRMKASGVEWLGEIPEHWVLHATKRLFRLVVEPAPDNNDLELLSIYTDIGVRPRRELEAKGNKATTTDGYWKVRKGDLIINKLLAWMGAIGISNYDGVTSPAYDILRPVRALEPQFYDYLFRCGICFSEFRRYSRGIMDMRLRLYFDEFGQLPMPYPPVSEQLEIVNYLASTIEKIDALTAEAERAVALLQERRTALVSAAVTGKIDVRGLVTKGAAE